MDWRLVAAACLTAVLALAHSVLGERFILRRLMHRDLPHLFGGDAFTKRTLRFAWHALTIAWIGIAAILVWAPGAVTVSITLVVLAATALITVTVSRGQHLSWVVDLVVIALLSWWLAAPETI